MKKILLTGAAGAVGTVLRAEYRDIYKLRLSDLSVIDNCLPNEDFIQADLSDPDDLREIVAGVDGIIHMGGFSVEEDWEKILNSNISGTYNLFEAARSEGVKRIVFASSNHAVGFYRRDQMIDHTSPFRPDTRYGVSKVFGESLGQLYADKYGAEVFNIRVGNIAAEPLDVRRLGIWISPRDIAQLISIGLEHPDIRHEVVYGMSDNARAWWDNSNALRLGYRPQDRSEDFAKKVLAEHPLDTGNTLADSLQGGYFVSTESGRDPTKPNLG